MNDFDNINPATSPVSGGYVARVPYLRSYWVLPTRLLAGCYPGDKDERRMEAKLGGLVASRIQLVINLMEENELDHDGLRFGGYELELLEMAGKAGIEIECVRFPVQDLSVPSRDLMVKTLDRIDLEIAQGKIVFVHCWGGKGRTGTVVGCFLARHGIDSGEGVIRRIAALRQNDPNAHQRSPETDEQREMVRNWDEGE